MIDFLNFLVTGFDCGGADVLRIIKFVFILLDIILFVVPMGLIIMVIVDFSKNVIAGKEDEMKKNLNIAIKRIIYCMVLFLIPTIVDFAIILVNDLGNNIGLGFDYVECITIAKEHDLSQYEMNYETFEPADGTNSYEQSPSESNNTDEQAST